MPSLQRPNSLCQWLTLALLCCALALWAQAAQAAERRVALVIGNASYPQRALTNPLNDAADLAAALRRLGFEVMERKNRNADELRRDLVDFQDKLSAGAVGLFYFAGHGVQAGRGQNYLLPVGVDYKRERDAEVYGLEVGTVLRRMEEAGTSLNLVILDACRDSPLPSEGRSMGSRGLGRMEAPSGSLIAFATAPGSTADENIGARNGLYTQHLLRALETPGLRLEDMFSRVRRNVEKDSHRRQSPEEIMKLTSDEPFFFVPAQQGQAGGSTRPPAVAGPTPPANLAIDDLQKEEATRQQWAQWQARMQGDFNKTAAFDGSADLRAKAWDRFLSSYAQNNPYSNQDKTLRADALQRKQAAEAASRPVAGNTPSPGPAGGVPAGGAAMPSSPGPAASQRYVWPELAGQVTGAGFSAGFFQKWFDGYASATGQRVLFQALGSTAGLRQLAAQTIDFAISDVALPPDELQAKGLLQFAVAGGGVVPVVNLPGVASGQLRLTGPVLADIYMGRITQWNDPAIAALNPGLALPSASIAVVRRADGAGTTFTFTQYLSQASPAWKAAVGSGTAVNWPVGAGGKGNEGVAAFVGRLPHAIGYVDWAFAQQGTLATVQLRNAADQWVGISADTVLAALGGVASGGVAPDASAGLVNPTGSRAWPMPVITHAVLHRVAQRPAATAAVLKFFDWVLAQPAGNNGAGGFVALSEAQVDAAKNSWSSVRVESGARLLSQR